MRRLFVALVLVATLVATMVIGACGSSTTATPTAAPAATKAPSTSTTPSASTPAAQPTAASKGTIQGITDTEIKLGAYHSLNGAISSVSIQCDKATKAYFSWLNDQGGINGRKVNYLVEDNGGDAQKGLASTKKLVEQDKVFIMVYGQNTPEGMVTRPYLIEKGIGHLMMGCPVSECLAPASGFWSAFYTYDKEAALLVKYGIDELKATKIGVVYINSDFGKDNLKGVKAAVAASGGKATLAAEVAINTGDTDMSAAAIKLKGAGVDVVYFGTYAQHVNGTWQEMKKLGFTPVLMGTQAMGVASVYALMKEDTEGFYTTYIPNPDLTSTTDTYVQNYKASLAKYATDIDATNPTNYRMWLFAQAAGEILTRAGKDIDKQGLAAVDKAALTFKDYGPLKISYTADDHTGIASTTVARWNVDKVVELKDYKKP